MRHASLSIVVSIGVAIMLAGCTETSTPPANQLDTTPPPDPDPPEDDMPPSSDARDDENDTPEGSDGVVVRSPEAPLVVGLELHDVQALFVDGSEVRITLEGSASDALVAGLTLPAGVSIVEGQLHHDGTFSGELTLEGVLRAEPGTHVLRAWGEVPLGPAGRAAPSVRLGVTDEGGQAATFDPTPEPSRFELSLHADPDDASVLTLRATSSVTVQARWELIVPDAFTLVEGEVVGDGELSPDAPMEHRVEVSLPDEWAPGYYALSAYLYPDPAVDGRLYSDALYYWADDGRVVVSDTPPGET